MRQQLFSRLAALLVLGFSLILTHAQVTAVKLNEILANNTQYTNADGSITDLLELYNAGATTLDLNGCSLSDSNAFPRRYIFPAGSIIGAGGYKVMTFTSVKPSSANNVPFGLKSSGGFVYFYGPIDSNTPISQIEYGLQVADLSIGCIPSTSTNWFLCTPTFGVNNAGAPNVAVALGQRSALKINEFLADESSGSDWFEIYNGTNKPVSIGGMFASDTTIPLTKFRFADLSFIGAGVNGFLQIFADSAVNKYPADHANFKLSKNAGSSLYLTDTDGSTIIDQIFSYPAQTADISYGRLPDGSANFVFFQKINDYQTQSPGEANFLILPYTNNLIVNEILTHTDPPIEDAVEFQNRGAASVNISGWWLSNQRINRQKWKVPNGAAIPPNGFRVLYEGTGWTNGFNSTNAAQPFTFNSAHGDQVVLSQVDGSGNLTGYIIYEAFEAAAHGYSFIHYDTSVANDYKFVAASRTTFGFDDPTNVSEFRAGMGLSNAYPRIGPIVINEIMFKPSNTFYFTNGVQTFGENPDEEYIELLNITTNSVPFYDPNFLNAQGIPTNYWRLQTAVSFNFPYTNLAPNAFCLIVGFDPYTNAAALANFRSRFNVPTSVPIFGPWIGKLKNSGDAIELYRPDPVQEPPHPDAGFVPFIRIDKVNYLSTTNWPGGAGGTGFSLQRKNFLLFGNDPINWASAAPNAGTASVGLQDTDGDGIPDAWEIAHGLNPNNAADAALDPDHDGVSNLGEYLAGTDPHDSNSVLRVAQIIPFVSTNVPLYVRFFAYSNTTYTVQYRNSLLPTSQWQSLGDVPAAPNNRFVDVPDPNAYKKTDRYYRVVAPAQN